MPDKLRILVVDDDRAIVQAISVRLRAAGYDVLTAFDGSAGLASATTNRPDTIVLDIRMPGLDGLTVLTKLREQDETKDIPVVMLSASVVDQRNALDIGAQFFLEKPYDAKTLVAAVESARTTKTRKA